MKLASVASMSDAVGLAGIPERERVHAVAGEPGSGQILVVFTLVVWLSCLWIGALGLALPYARPQPVTTKEPAPVQTEILQVELAIEPLPVLEAVLPPSPLMPLPPMLPELVSVAPPPALTAVTEPTPAIAFAVPVEGPVRIVEARQAAHIIPPAATVHTATRASNAPANASITALAAVARAPAPPVETLRFGVGEGRQPAPAYPGRARREGQEGTVGVRLTVGEDGRVMGVDALSPAPWPLLNESAVRTVRQRWRFAAGRLRVYDVAIRFQISK